VATLLLSGPRIGEQVEDRWADVHLANGRIQFDSKTPAGCRWVRLLPALRDELAALKAQRDPSARDYVFGTARGRKRSESNIRSRVLAKARLFDVLDELGADVRRWTPVVVPVRDDREEE